MYHRKVVRPLARPTGWLLMAALVTSSGRCVRLGYDATDEPDAGETGSGGHGGMDSGVDAGADGGDPDLDGGAEQSGGAGAGAGTSAGTSGGAGAGGAGAGGGGGAGNGCVDAPTSLTVSCPQTDPVAVVRGLVTCEITLGGAANLMQAGCLACTPVPGLGFLNITEDTGGRYLMEVSNADGAAHADTITCAWDSTPGLSGSDSVQFDEALYANDFAATGDMFAELSGGAWLEGQDVMRQTVQCPGPTFPVAYVSGGGPWQDLTIQADVRLDAICATESLNQAGVTVHNHSDLTCPSGSQPPLYTCVIDKSPGSSGRLVLAGFGHSCERPRFLTQAVGSGISTSVWYTLTFSSKRVGGTDELECRLRGAGSSDLVVNFTVVDDLAGSDTPVVSAGSAGLLSVHSSASFDNLNVTQLP